METTPPSVARFRGRSSRPKVVLRAGNQWQRLEVLEESESQDKPEALDAETHYDHAVWDTIPRQEQDCSGGEELLNRVSKDVFNEKLELSGGLVHSTPHRVVQVTPIHHPMHPQSVSSAMFKDGADSSDDESDAVLFDSPQTVPIVQVHPEHSNNTASCFSKSLPPLPSGTRPPDRKSSTEGVPTHSTHPQKRRLVRNNRIHPDGGPTSPDGQPPPKPPPKSNPTLPGHSAAFEGTSSSNVSYARLFSTDSLNSTSVGPLLTASLRKGGTMPSAETSWEFDGERQLESCFPDRHARIFVVTWNMCEGKELPPCLDDLLLPTSYEQAADMYVIGTQESSSLRHEWELLLQQTLGPAFVLVHSASLGMIYLVLFLRRDLIWYCSAVRSAGYATRPGTMIKTKGGVGLCFTLFGSSFLFITSHFTASDHKVSERNSDMQRIAANLALSDESSRKGGGVDAFDYVFWFGDFNYRVEMEREKVVECLDNSDCMPLLLQDQLTKEILQGNVFKEFSEQPITFPPTYKFDLHSDRYDSSERKRTPAWTDRILFCSHASPGAIAGCGYDSCRTLRCSDHRPVFASFRVKLEPSSELDGIPNTVVTFEREIYLKGLPCTLLKSCNGGLEKTSVPFTVAATLLAHQQRKQMAQLSASQRAEDEPDGPSSSSRRVNPPRHVTSSVCTLF